MQGGHTAVQHLQADGDVNDVNPSGDKDTTPWDRAVQEQHEHSDVFRQLLDTQADGKPQDVNRAVPLFTFQSLGHELYIMGLERPRNTVCRNITT